MTTASAPAIRAGSGLARSLAVIGLALAVAAFLLLVAGPLGWRAGWWHFSLAFNTLMPYAGYAGIAAVAVSVLALLLGVAKAPRRGVAIAVLGIAIGAVAAYFPWEAGEMRGKYPRLNDITTDFANPPSLAFSEAMRKAEEGGPAAYGGADLEALQQKSYPGIEPATLDLPPAQAFDKALATATAKGWTIVKSDPAAGVIEAYDRSRWFGFTDDIAIRVSAAGPAASSHSRVDVRSHSRQGRGDFGVNAARVRGFLAALKGSA
jgi:uncharacterized protein (DUF1499 family)